MNIKKALCLLLSYFMLAGTAFAAGIPAKGFKRMPAESLDSIIASMVRIEARPDFAFRFDLTNSTTGETSPVVNDYYLSAYKVTNGQYAKFVAETGHRAPSYWKNGVYPQGKEDHPVLNVSHGDAVSYCAWLSSKYKNTTFRLPTEAEWENAAMGEYYGNGSVKYPNGAGSPSYDAATHELTTTFNYNGVIAARLFKEYGSGYTVNYIKGDFAGESETLGECISISATGGVSNWANHGGSATRGYFLQTDLYQMVSANGGNTTPVGSYAPNSLGLYDMAGNSWDITSSIITANNGLEKGIDCYAVRGGSWYATARSCTFYYRGEGRKDSPSSTVGFRLAADSIGEDDINGSWNDGSEISASMTVTDGTVTVTVNNADKLTDAVSVFIVSYGNGRKIMSVKNISCAAEGLISANAAQAEGAVTVKAFVIDGVTCAPLTENLIWNA
ncbi:MAG: SUMF1/EgtB/PvdO family nonheme iron enzyme [Clostridia bacterium]|nr:SUMF1/EgtB/PvdO family nonheme iron enzyme [Clostridia bacterium]